MVTPNEEHQDPVWQLLDASSPRQAPPTLLHGVLRVIRSTDLRKPLPFPFWLPALAPAAAALAILAASGLDARFSENDSTVPFASKSEQILHDFEVISNMDLIHVPDEDQAWFDNSQL